MKTKEKKIGTFEFGNKILVSDPMYRPGSRYTALVENVMPGKYVATATLGDFNELGKRVMTLNLRHEDFEDVYPEDIESRDIGVDSALCGFWNPEKFAAVKSNKAEDEKFFSKLYSLSKVGAICKGVGIVSETGFGDGVYPLYVGRNDKGQIVSFEVVFIDDDEE